MTEMPKRMPPGWPALPSRVAALIEVGRSFDFEEEHEAHVARLSARLFDQLTAVHGLGEPARELLLAAAVLHDIGWSLGAAKHNKSSARLIRETELSGCSERQRAIIALLARYHRGAVPRSKHRRFSALAPADRDLVRKLAAILRVADGLDRKHCGVVEDLRIEPEGTGFHLELTATGAATWEVWAAMRKADLFEQVYGQLRIEETAAAEQAPTRGGSDDLGR